MSIYSQLEITKILRLINFYSLFVIMLFFSPSVSAQKATFITKSGKQLLGTLTKMDNDTLQIEIEKSNGETGRKKIHKAYFLKVLFITGEYLDLSLSKWPIVTKASNTTNDDWDDIDYSEKAELQIEKFTVAVTQFDARGGVATTDAASLSDRFIEKLIATGAVRVMERNEMNLILKEQGFQQTGACTDNECLVEIGQLIAVQKIIAVTVGKVGGMYSVAIKMMDVATGAIDKTISEDCDCTIEELLTVTMERLAKRLVGQKVTKRVNNIEIKRGDAALFVKTKPVGARIFLNGKLMDGVTPTTFDNLTAGRYLLKASKGDMEATTKITIEANKVMRAELRLTKKRTILKMSTNPSEAEVYLNNMPERKVKPDNITPSIFDNIKPGKYTIALFKAGFMDSTFVVECIPNQTTDIIINLEPATQTEIAKQKRFIKKRKKHRLSVKFNIGGLVIAAGGTLSFLWGVIDKNTADESLNIWKASTFKDGQKAISALDTYYKKDGSAKIRRNVGYILWGAGAMSIATGIILKF